MKQWRIMVIVIGMQYHHLGVYYIDQQTSFIKVYIPHVTSSFTTMFVYFPWQEGHRQIFAPVGSVLADSNIDISYFIFLIFLLKCLFAFIAWQ